MKENTKLFLSSFAIAIIGMILQWIMGIEISFDTNSGILWGICIVMIVMWLRKNFNN